MFKRTLQCDEGDIHLPTQYLTCDSRLQKNWGDWKIDRASLEERARYVTEENNSGHPPEAKMN